MDELSPETLEDSHIRTAFDKDNFAPGEAVSGTLYISLTCKKSIQEIRVLPVAVYLFDPPKGIKRAPGFTDKSPESGVAAAPLGDCIALGKDEIKWNYFHEHYVRTMAGAPVAALEEVHDDRIEFDFPFSFQLPNKLHPSFARFGGFTAKYAAVVTVDRQKPGVEAGAPAHSSVTVPQYFGVAVPDAVADKVEPPKASGASAAKGSGANAISLSARLSNPAPVPGETVVIYIDVSNWTRRKVTDFVLKIKETADVSAMGYKFNRERVILERKFPAEFDSQVGGAYQKKSLALDIRVPSQARPFSSSFIDLKWQLEIRALLDGTEESVDVALPLVTSPVHVPLPRAPAGTAGAPAAVITQLLKRSLAEQTLLKAFTPAAAAPAKPAPAAAAANAFKSALLSKIKTAAAAAKGGKSVKARVSSGGGGGATAAAAAAAVAAEAAASKPESGASLASEPPQPPPAEVEKAPRAGIRFSDDTADGEGRGPSAPGSVKAGRFLNLNLGDLGGAEGGAKTARKSARFGADGGDGSGRSRSFRSGGQTDRSAFSIRINKTKSEEHLAKGINAKAGQQKLQKVAGLLKLAAKIDHAKAGEKAAEGEGGEPAAKAKSLRGVLAALIHKKAERESFKSGKSVKSTKSAKSMKRGSGSTKSLASAKSGGGRESESEAERAQKGSGPPSPEKRAAPEPEPPAALEQRPASAASGRPQRPESAVSRRPGSAASARPGSAASQAAAAPPPPPASEGDSSEGLLRPGSAASARPSSAASARPASARPKGWLLKAFSAAAQAQAAAEAAAEAGPVDDDAALGVVQDDDDEGGYGADEFESAVERVEQEKVEAASPPPAAAAAHPPTAPEEGMGAGRDALGPEPPSAPATAPGSPRERRRPVSAAARASGGPPELEIPARPASAAARPGRPVSPESRSHSPGAARPGSPLQWQRWIFPPAPLPRMRDGCERKPAVPKQPPSPTRDRRPHSPTRRPGSAASRESTWDDFEDELRAIAGEEWAPSPKPRGPRKSIVSAQALAAVLGMHLADVEAVLVGPRPAERLPAQRRFGAYGPRWNVWEVPIAQEEAHNVRRYQVREPRSNLGWRVFDGVQTRAFDETEGIYRASDRARRRLLGSAGPSYPSLSHSASGPSLPLSASASAASLPARPGTAGKTRGVDVPPPAAMHRHASAAQLRARSAAPAGLAGSRSVSTPLLAPAWGR